MRRAPLLVLTGLLAVLLVVGMPAAQAKKNPVTPGNFTGYGFDQCLAPTQKTMDTWLRTSPFLAVGIYISGDSRGCRSQPNLTKTWVATQLAQGWRLLPITLGPQASCNPKFPRYKDDKVINPKPGSTGRFTRARKQGRAEAVSAVDAATALGLAPGSTLWYDLEGWILHEGDRCSESALAFLSAWTKKLHGLGWQSGVYSSAGSGIKLLDDTRVERPDEFHLPDRLWIARWSGTPGKINDSANTYLRKSGWKKSRVHQYQGGHNETWGGVTINIDRNWLDLRDGPADPAEVHCDGIAVDQPTYLPLAQGTDQADLVKALKCLLKEQDAFSGKLGGRFGTKILAAAQAWQKSHGFKVSPTWTRAHWMSLLAVGTGEPVLKLGSTGPVVRQVQRTLNAAYGSVALSVTGRFNKPTVEAITRYQKDRGQTANGIVVGRTWRALRAGKR